MMLFDPEVGRASEGGMWQEGRMGEGDNECYSETKKNQSWRMIPGDQKRVTLHQRLKWSMK
jgi:hypothetical protein